MTSSDSGLAPDRGRQSADQEPDPPVPADGTVDPVWRAMFRSAVDEWAARFDPGDPASPEPADGDEDS